MKKVKYSIVIVCMLLLVISIYSIVKDYKHFFHGTFSKLTAAAVICCLSYIYIDELVIFIKGKKKLSLFRFNLSIFLLLISFCWIINQYLIELNTEDIDRADCLFNLLATILTLKIYILLKYILTDTALNTIRSSIEIDY